MDIVLNPSFNIKGKCKNKWNLMDRNGLELIFKL